MLPHTSSPRNNISRQRQGVLKTQLYPNWYQCVRAQLLSHVGLFVIPWTIVHKAPLSMELCRQEYWSGLPFPPPGDLPDPGIEPVSPLPPALAGRFFITDPPGKKPVLEYSRLT